MNNKQIAYKISILEKDELKGLLFRSWTKQKNMPMPMTDYEFLMYMSNPASPDEKEYIYSTEYDQAEYLKCLRQLEEEEAEHYVELKKIVNQPKGVNK